MNEIKLMNIMTFQDLFKPVGEKREYEKELIADLGDTVISSGDGSEGKLKDAFQTYWDLDDDDAEKGKVLKEIMSDNNKKKIYLSYLSLAEKSGEYDQDQIDGSRAAMGVNHIKESTDNLKPEPEEPELENQLDGFGYKKGTRHWWILEQAKIGVKFEVLQESCKEHGWSGDKSTVQVLISQINKDIRDAGIKKKIKALADKVHRIYTLRQIDDYLENRKNNERSLRKQQAKKDRAVLFLELLHENVDQESSDFHISIEEDDIVIDIKHARVKFFKTKEAGRAVLPLLAAQDYGIEV